MAAEGKRIKSFEDLFIFREARELTKQVYAFTRQGPAAKDWGFVDQIRRSAVSVLSNIAEGFDRQSRPEFIRALFIARGSCAEVRAQLLVALDQKYLPAKDHEEMSPPLSAAQRRNLQFDPAPSKTDAKELRPILNCHSGSISPLLL